MFGREDAPTWRRRGGRRRTGDLVSTSASCSGARVEAKETRLRAGKRSDDHEVSILIRLGGGGRVGRAPSNVSTMIIRPPQHGQRRAGGTSSASLSTSARERSWAPSDAASVWRARSMFRARTVPANRP